METYSCDQLDSISLFSKSWTGAELTGELSIKNAKANYSWSPMRRVTVVESNHSVREDSEDI